MALLAVFQPDQRIAARVTEALAPPHDVVHPDSWPAMDRFLATVQADGCIVDADHPSRAQATNHIRRLRRQQPGLAIVAFADLEAGDAAAFRLGEDGADGVLPSHADNRRSDIRAVVEHALDCARATQVARALRGRLDPVAVQALAWTVEHAREQPDVGRLARALATSPRGLRERLRDSGLPQPNRLLLWGRLLHTGARLSRDRCTVEEAAYALGYSTGSALTRAMRRETGMTPGEIMEGGGLAAVLAALFPRRGR